MPEAEKYIFDFKNVAWVEPFALICLANQLKFLRESKIGSEFKAVNFQEGEANSYAAHMGFFRAFGLQHGKFPNEASGNDNYNPIRILNVKTLIRRARDNKIRIEEELDIYARDMACKLIRNNSNEIIKILTFSIREMLRNIIDHSDASKLAFCLQYSPSRESVEFSLLDNGCGIRNSLVKNPNLKNIESDSKSLDYAVLPGVSGNFVSKGYISDDPWENSGYGLYMASELCRRGGNFFLCSKTAGKLLDEKDEIKFSTSINGTALRLIFNLSSISSIESELSTIRRKGIKLAKEISYANIKPSSGSTKIFDN
ncbi:hypothetical protein ACQUW5_02400 [Legionella sp. CNM-1927-20]|uniref:hypothetical protein n=1 Tax=Legionella sp. CNM-1927-20 TaxID=3422221 RepID=UPI00403B2A2F